MVGHLRLVMRARALSRVVAVHTLARVSLRALQALCQNLIRQLQDRAFSGTQPLKTLAVKALFDAGRGCLGFHGKLPERFQETFPGHVWEFPGHVSAIFLTQGALGGLL